MREKRVKFELKSGAGAGAGGLSLGIIVHIWQRKKPVVGLLIVVRTPANLQTSKKLEYDWSPSQFHSRMKKTFLNQQKEENLFLELEKKGLSFEQQADPVTALTK